MTQKLVVIIPHFNGEAILRRCLHSLENTAYPDFSVFIVDNGSTDGSMDMVRREFPGVRIHSSRINRGYAGGCNTGLRFSHSEYVVFLNNDAVVTRDWLTPVMALFEKHPDIAAIQPKILSTKQSQQFDYSGAAGGEMDIFGYPFARGRLFDYLEQDSGQYEGTHEIFWASGAAMGVRRSALHRVGYFEEAFFAHMEEIDLCWRFHLAGYRVASVTESIVYHQSGGTLGKERLEKMILNHRNNLLMVLRNYSTETLLLLLPVRLILEFCTVLFSLISGQFKRALAVPVGLWGAGRHWNTVLRGRKKVKQIRVCSDSGIRRRLYHGSVAFSFFLQGKKTYLDLYRK